MRHSKEKGVTLLLGIVSLTFIVPMIGLSVDVGFIYSVKTKLQAAVDGSALAAARSLNVGLTTDAQATTAKNNAVNWFYATFPTSYFGTKNTTMTTSNVRVFDDPNNPHLRNVTVTATTSVDTFFMKWLGFGATNIGASGNASRRDVVAMIVLDRSGSMNNGTTPSACQNMVTAAKIFTGQFAAGRDQIGLISFSDNAYIHSVPSTNFQTTLGYNNDQGSGTGAIDTLTCQGGTNTAEGISMAYQLLYQTNLSGALNIMLLETDGLPNTLTMNFWDNTNKVTGLTSGSGCTDTSGKTVAGGGFKTSTVIPSWTAGLSLTSSPFLTTTGYYSSIPAGMIGAVASSDPGSTYFFLNINYWTTWTQSQSSANHFNSTSYMGSTQAPGCAFDSTHVTTNPSDINWFPATDVFGNSMNPSYSYKGVTTDTQGHIVQNGWANYQNAVLNATDNSAYIARANTTLPVYFFAIGLGGNSTTGPPDPVLLQRMANDPEGDTFNDPALYQPCADETACTTYTSQPAGTFIYSSNSTYLAQAFLRISSQVLRLSK
jgi:Flp pilus assembly protein TadG